MRFSSITVGLASQKAITYGTRRSGLSSTLSGEQISVTVIAMVDVNGEDTFEIYYTDIDGSRHLATITDLRGEAVASLRKIAKQEEL